MPMMQQLGLAITSEQRDLLMNDVLHQRPKGSSSGQSGQQDAEDKAGVLHDSAITDAAITEKEFRLIFKTCLDNQTMQPSEGIKAKLLLIMSRSKNPFIQMLSNEEQRMLIDGRGQSIKAFPFVLGSFAVGAFAILPYLALRTTNPKFTGQKNRLLMILDSRWTGIMLTGVTLGILIAGIYWGDWPDFVAQWSDSRFIHVMSLDFLILSLLFPTLIVDDMAHRSLKNPKLWEFIAFIPLLGALIYLCLRPPLLVSALEDRPQDSPLPLSS